jgi:hypothetical protein
VGTRLTGTVVVVVVVLVLVLEDVVDDVVVTVVVDATAVGFVGDPALRQQATGKMASNTHARTRLDLRMTGYSRLGRGFSSCVMW